MTGLHISSPQEDSVKEPPCGLCYKFFDDGPLPPCFLLSLIGSIQESHDLGAGASGIGGESCFACAACHALFNRPINSRRINRGGSYIGKAAALFHSGEACRTPDIKNRRTASARGISIENSAIPGNDIIFFRPQRGLIKIVAFLYVGECVRLASRFGRTL